MARSTSWIGLNRKAFNFVKGMESEEYSFLNGGFGEPYPIYKYIDEKGEEYFEILQADPWASGPIIFTCLKRKSDDKKIFKWSKRDMKEYI